MPRPDAAMLDPRRYPFSCALETRFGDLDINWHVNNVALSGLLEEARGRFYRHSGTRAAMEGHASMVASMAIEFLGEVNYPEPLGVHVAIEEIGRTSHRLVQIAHQGGPPLAFCRAVIINVGKQGPEALPPHFARDAAPWLLRQEVPA